MQAGIEVRAGVDVDPVCRYPFETNLGAAFHETSIRNLRGADIESMWSENSTHLLAGCAPCQPFSSQRRGADTKSHPSWDLLLEFDRLVQETLPEYATMENVAPLRKQDVFRQFLRDLTQAGYHIDFDVLKAERFGLPQRRRRLVLIASRGGPITLPEAWLAQEDEVTVGQALAGLPPAGGRGEPRRSPPSCSTTLPDQRSTNSRIETGRNVAGLASRTEGSMPQPPLRQILPILLRRYEPGGALTDYNN